MKVFTFFVAGCLMAANCFSQVNVGNAGHPKGGNGGNLEKEDLIELKGTTTVVVLQDKDKIKLADYKKAAEQVWKFNKIEFITQSDYSKYIDKAGYSFMTFRGILMKKSSMGMPSGASSASFYLKYWLPYQTKKGKIKEKTFAVIQLYLDVTTTGTLLFGNIDENELYERLVSDKSTFYNLSPGFMKCYLTIVNNHLMEGKKHYIFEDEKNELLLKNLSKDTLFLPDYIKIGNGLKNGKTMDIKELMEDYEFPYAVLTSDGLSSRILNAKKSLYCFSFIFFSSQKFLTIFEAKTGTIVFSSYESMSLKGLNSGDFKDISKKIKKAGQ